MPAVSTNKFLARQCRESYYTFFRTFWPVVVQERYVHNWHIERLCNDLQEIAERVFADLPKISDFVWNSPPGSTKPVWEAMPVMMADGTWKKLRDIEIGDRVIGKSGQPCLVSAVHIQGSLPCVRITTFGGRKIITALDHPILTADGWMAANAIQPNQMLALMHTPKIQYESEHTSDEFILAGYLIGDGSVTGKNCSLTSVDPDYIEDFCLSARCLGFSYTIRKKGICTRIGLREGRGGRSAGPRVWLRSIGLAGKSSYTKCVPDFVWKGSDSDVAAFLAAYFHCDGCVSYKDGKKRNITISMCTVSKQLAVGMQRLFLRLGIAMRLRRRVAKNGFAYNRDLKDYVTYNLETSDQDTATRFMEIVPLKSRKLAKLIEFMPRRRTFEQLYWPDRVASVEVIGKNPCRCLTVEGDNSFCVDGVVVHNSLPASVLWQPWIWTRMPSARFLSGSYSERLALNLSRQSRDCVKSEKYKEMFPEIVLRDDQDTKGFFMNTLGGWRFATGVGGSVTGMHAHVLCIDDPIDPLGALSDLVLNEANIWINESLADRKVDKMLVPTVMIMQRLHQIDPTGYWMEIGKKFKHRCLPGDNTYPIIPKEWEKFYVDGLLDPIRLPQSLLDEKFKSGESYYAGQYGQFPVPRGGAMFKIDQLNYSSHPPVRWKRGPVRYWDKAISLHKKAAFTVGTEMAIDFDDKVWILDVVRGRWNSGDRENRLLSVAKLDGKSVRIGMEQEPAASGKESVENSIKRLVSYGYRAIADKVTGDKTARADTFSVQVNNGNVVLVTAHWNSDFVDEMRYFPNSRYKDQIDSASGAHAMLEKRRVRIGAL